VVELAGIAPASASIVLNRLQV